MADANGWPDSQRLGVPLESERDGWHWVGSGPTDQSPACLRWWAQSGRWEFDQREWLPEDFGRVQYFGPVRTDADLTAAVQAEREACAQACLSLAADQDQRNARHPGHAEVYPNWRHRPENFREAAEAIRARGPLTALDAERAAAEWRGAERMKAAAIQALEQFWRDHPRTPGAGNAWLTEVIRALPTDAPAGDAEGGRS